MATNERRPMLMRIVNFYVEGFRSMTIGKTLWAIIILKLIIMFGILKIFFFPNILNSKFDNDDDKASYVRSEMLNNR